MSEMPLDEAMAKAREFDERNKGIPSVSRTLVAEIERLRVQLDDAISLDLICENKGLRECLDANREERQRAEYDNERLRGLLTALEREAAEAAENWRRIAAESKGRWSSMSGYDDNHTEVLATCRAQAWEAAARSIRAALGTSQELPQERNAVQPAAKSNEAAADLLRGWLADDSHDAEQAQNLVALRAAAQPTAVLCQKCGNNGDYGGCPQCGRHLAGAGG